MERPWYTGPSTLRAAAPRLLVWAPMGAHTWSCPACGRQVPLRVAACHCGMTRERAEEQAAARAAAEAAALAPAAAVAAPGLPVRTARRPTRGPRLRWADLPGDVKGLLGGVALVGVAAIAWLAFGPRPGPVVPVLGYADAGPPPAPRPTPKPTPPFKLPWWK